MTGGAPGGRGAGTRGEYGVYIGGDWRRGSGEVLEAVSPATGEAFAEVFAGDREDAAAAVGAALASWPSWAALSPFERAEVCDAAAAAVRAHREELARILTQDQGKPLVAEAYDEVDELALYFAMAAAEARRHEGALPASSSAGRLVLVERLPLGVVGVVSPWNWPYTMGAELFAPALAAGNTVVWVPAPTTSACSAALVAVLTDAGFPPGVLNFVPGPGPVVGDAVVSDPRVAAVGFVGSVATGRVVAERAAGKTQLLELGGNGPFVVLADADLDLATRAALEAAFLCAGQSCTAGERFLVEASVREEFVERVAAAVLEEVRLGDPFDATTTMGPLNNDAVAAKFDRHVADALSRGARLVTGGGRREGLGSPLYAEPTVLDAVPEDAEIVREETFGPVVPVVEVASAEEALVRTNASPFGLTAAVFTRDLERGLAFARGARAGWVNVNHSTNLWESHLPFGGRSGSVSGRGRVGGRYPYEAFTEPRTIVLPVPRLGGGAS